MGRRISLIWAEDDAGGLGNNGGLPWYHSGDMKYFKRTTQGKVVVMGRRTFRSMGYRPLKDRTNVVLSSAPRDYKGVVVLPSVAKVLEKYTEGELMVIGGAEVYKAFMPYADRLYRTVIYGEHEADTFAPEFNAWDFYWVGSYWDDGCVHNVYNRVEV